ncbi:hypothetical protein [Euzebya tangerina]|uniref:hypothetical protein n=1 Tax=Euzebya tangerina TaxID=591198 RepID=UPI001F0CC441|nr:hypothetical protein [Euzebya tangerina]
MSTDQIGIFQDLEVMGQTVTPETGQPRRLRERHIGPLQRVNDLEAVRIAEGGMPCGSFSHVHTRTL